MNDLVIHQSSADIIDSFIKQPSHALLIVGPSGIGKQSLADSIAEAVLAITPATIDSYAYVKKIRPTEKNTISIDEIRQLERFLSLRVPLKKDFNRAVIIQDAHSLSLEAQNALLKMLEEPPSGTIIILTTKHSQALLPTIRSRVQSINLTRPNKKQINSFFEGKDYSRDSIDRTYAVSGGLPGLMSSMLSDTDHPLTSATSYARELLGSTIYERLLKVDELTKQRQLALDTTSILQQMSHISLQTALGNRALKWQSILKASYGAHEGLSNNGNSKLILTKLMLSL